MKLKTPAQGQLGQGLDFDTRNSNSSTKPTKLNTTRNGKKTLQQIARKWAALGYYPTPSAAMRVLLGEVNHG